MEIDLYRDDGIVHVITTGVSYVDKVLWVSTYFGACRYDGRHWRGFFAHESGLPSDFTNNVKARSANEAWFCTDKGLGACMDFETDTWVAYTRSQDGTGKAVVTKDKEVLETVEGPVNVPHNFIICADIDGNDVWVGTGKGLGWGDRRGLLLGPEGAGTDASTKALSVSFASRSAWILACREVNDETQRFSGLAAVAGFFGAGA